MARGDRRRGGKHSIATIRRQAMLTLAERGIPMPGGHVLRPTQAQLALIFGRSEALLSSGLGQARGEREAVRRALAIDED